MKVSVVVPNYNYSQYLPSRLKSIINQSYKNIEIIFLDDASNDDSVIVAEEILKKSGKEYSFIVNKENSGSVFKQWNKGIEYAKGDYIWIAEADDFCSLEFLRKTCEMMDKDQSIVISYTDSQLIDEKNRIIQKDFFKKIHGEIDPVKWERNYINNGTDEIKNNLFIKNTIPNVSAVLFRKKHLEDAVKFIEEYKLSGDWFTYIKLLSGNGKIAYLKDKLNYNRHHNKRVTSKSSVSAIYFNESRKIIRYLLKNYKIDKEIQIRYLKNYLNQNSIIDGTHKISSEELNDLEDLFGSEILFEVIGRIIQKLNKDNNKLRASLFYRISKITLTKIIGKIKKEKVYI